jgi:peptidoglycan biosynthesis protein MviN/MurJ (putative lipid II flippase)
VGAAIASLATYLLIFILALYQSNRRFNYNPNSRRILKFAMAGASAIATLAIVGHFIEVVRWYDLLLISVISYAVFTLVLLVEKEFTKKDIDFFLDVISVREMWTYIKSEVGRK